MVSVFQDLCRIETMVQSDKNYFTITMGKITGEGLEIDFSDLRSKLEGTLKTSCFCSCPRAFQKKTSIKTVLRSQISQFTQR